MENDKPLFPLREVYDLRAWVKADPDNKQDYVCGLIAATRDAATAAMKSGRMGGWLFGQEDFILAVLAIRALNQRHAIHTYGTDLAQRLPTAWNGMADALEAYARDIPRHGCWMGELPPAKIPRGIIDSGWNYPVSGDTLEVFFKWCESKALDAFPQDRDKVETRYKTGVFNIPLNTTQTLARIEAGQGGTQAAANLAAKNSAAAKRAAEQIAQTTAGLPAAIAEVKAAIAEVKAEAAGAKVAAEGARAAAEANGTKLDVITGRSTDPVISTPQMASMCDVTCRLVELWEKWLKDPEHKNGRRPPRGYSLATRCDSGRAKVFADTYKSNRAFHAARGKPKRRSFDENRDAPDTSFADSLDNGAMDK